MKNPNGYGTIKLLSGSRRKPFVFMITVNGKQKALGYFSTKLEAMAYQVDYNKSHGLSYNGPYVKTTENFFKRVFE